MISVKHTFVSLAAEGPDPTKVRTSDWNDNHAISLSTGKVVGRKSAGDGPAEEVDAVSRVLIQKFNTSGTYTPTPGMIYCVIECVGGGGGGGGAANNASTAAGAGGGGAGSYSRKLVSAADIGLSKTVTIGAAGTGGAAGQNNGTAGGDTSVGTLCVGKGGQGSVGASGSGTGTKGAVGGVAGTGDIAAPGMSGESGWLAIIVTLSPFAGNGGSSPFGAGGLGGAGVGTTAGGAATGNGAGGGGAASYNNGGAAAGGDGSAGLVVITEFCGPGL